MSIHYAASISDLRDLDAASAAGTAVIDALLVMEPALHRQLRKDDKDPRVFRIRDEPAVHLPGLSRRVKVDGIGLPDPHALAVIAGLVTTPLPGGHRVRLYRQGGKEWLPVTVPPIVPAVEDAGPGCNQGTGGMDEDE